MALNDIQIYDEAAFGYPGDVKYTVAAGSAASIKQGEPVIRALGGSNVSVMATNSPQVGTHYIVGIAATTSTDTVGAAGEVYVTKDVEGTSYLIAPNVAATWDTQAEYDALVGKRVLIDLTTGSYTILASDAAGNGCVVLPLDVKKHPGKVRFAFRRATNALA